VVVISPALFGNLEPNQRMKSVDTTFVIG